MTLADTSVWIAHFRLPDADFGRMLTDVQVLMHPFVMGELACGNLRNRSETLDWLGRIPRLAIANPGEVMVLIESKQLYGSGLGWVDVNLLASALIDDCTFWTIDKTLQQVAAQAGVHTYSPRIH